jgi:hypothetical protein
MYVPNSYQLLCVEMTKERYVENGERRMFVQRVTLPGVNHVGILSKKSQLEQVRLLNIKNYSNSYKEKS